ncbi:MAG: glutamate-5-semialdehyde dehydrogenase [Bacteroidota bacterium]
MGAILQYLINAKKAQKSIAGLSDIGKKDLISRLADTIQKNSERVIAENLKDLLKMDENDPKRDRLLLDQTRITGLCKSLLAVSQLPDPTQSVLTDKVLPNGLHLKKITVPLGVVAVIYESRPNVTLDVASLCLRSGNVALLRGGQDALHTNLVLVSLIQQVLAEAGLDVNIVQQLPPEREHIIEILTAEKYIDVIIPRGSNQLIEYVRKNATVPVIETGAGVCHTYVEASADLLMAADVVVNAKVSRPSVCNALDTILVDMTIAEDFITGVSKKLEEHHVEIFADEIAFTMLQKANYPLLTKANPEDFGREFLDFKCSIKVVSGLDEAMDHIATYSSKHSEAIITRDYTKSDVFLAQVDAAVVYLNASTRFTDGEVFDLGAEIGISTQKLHARGPFALEKLVTEKWIVKGEGQVR